MSPWLYSVLTALARHRGPLLSSALPFLGALCVVPCSVSAFKSRYRVLPVYQSTKIALSGSTGLPVYRSTGLPVYRVWENPHMVFERRPLRTRLYAFCETDKLAPLIVPRIGHELHFCAHPDHQKALVRRTAQNCAREGATAATKALRGDDEMVDVVIDESARDALADMLDAAPIDDENRGREATTAA
jgi:hypothetical protein